MNNIDKLIFAWCRGFITGKELREGIALQVRIETALSKHRSSNVFT